MSDTLTAVDELFASPDFDDRLTEWQQAKNAHDYQGLLLQDHLVQIYGGDGYDEDRDPSRISESVSYDLEIEAEEFEDLHFHDNKALRLHRLRSSAEDQEDTAKETLLDFSKELGVSQFALYGIWLHTRESNTLPRPALKAKVQAAEDDFNALDRYIRHNQGQLLTAIELGAYAGRLGSGGITLSDNRRVVIPLANDATCYGTGLHADMPKIFSSDKFHIEAHTIHSIFGSQNYKMFENWVDLLRIDDWFGIGNSGAVFAIGEPVEGPPYIANGKDLDYFRMIVDKIRTVGNAAASK